MTTTNSHGVRYLYVATSEEKDFLKIGLSSNPRVRWPQIRAQARASLHRDFQHIVIIPGSPVFEEYVIGMAGRLARPVQRKREWFQATPELWAFIKSLELQVLDLKSFPSRMGKPRIPKRTPARGKRLDAHTRLPYDVSMDGKQVAGKKRRITRDFFRKAGRKGGKIGGPRRVETTTPEQRSAWARKAALARHARDKEQKPVPMCQVVP